MKGSQSRYECECERAHVSVLTSAHADPRSISRSLSPSHAPVSSQQDSFATEALAAQPLSDAGDGVGAGSGHEGGMEGAGNSMMHNTDDGVSGAGHVTQMGPEGAAGDSRSPAGAVGAWHSPPAPAGGAGSGLREQFSVTMEWSHHCR